MFRVPSSTPPSTPDRRRQSHNAPSTTPAGPPPSQSYISSTPAGPPPPKGLYGSRPDFDPDRVSSNRQPLFGSSPPKNGVLEGVGSGSIRTSTEGRPGSQGRRTSSWNSHRFQSSPPKATEGFGYEEDEDMDEEDAEGEEDEDMDGEDEGEQFEAPMRRPSQDRLSYSLASRSSADEPYSTQAMVHSGAKQEQYDLLALAKGLVPNTARPTMTEPDDVILETEQLLGGMHDALQGDTPRPTDELLSDTARSLLALWRTSSSRQLVNASKWGDLLLGIHLGIIPEDPSPPTSQALIHPDSKSFTPIPKVLLNWINTHRPADEEVVEVLNQSGGYSKHACFWEAVQTTALRGQLTTTVKLLNGANFAVALTAEEDAHTSGYRGPQLEYANHAAQKAVQLLHECPGLMFDNWDMKSHDWNIFRQKTHQAKRTLEEFAEGESQSRFTMSQSFRPPSQFGLSQSHTNNFNLSTVSRKVESKVPWSVYQALLRLYDIILGNEDEIVAWSADWVEATLFLAIWWKGEDELPQGGLGTSRRTVARSLRSHETDVKLYTGRLEAALAAVFNGGEEAFAISTTNTFDIGIVCILDGNIEAALQMMRGQSTMAASAIAELASVGGWLKRSGVFDQLNQSDMLLLSFSQPVGPSLSKDDLLVAYVEQISSKGQLKSADGAVSREGWELAIEILGRLEDAILATERIQRILDSLPLQSSEQIDKVTQLCHNMGLSSQALGISMKFAEYLHTNTQNYGDAIMYYARAHVAPKIQEVLRALVAHCLIKSVAYPPLAELDATLNELITAPKKTLTKLASFDSEAAELLANSLSGYATIRKFYDLRDEEVVLGEGEKPAHRPMARKRAAANALVVIISSAASSIRGGLYDPEVETAVQVDVLLPLLGEALVFVNQPKRTLTLRHLYDLLAAVEDLSTAPSMIRTQCEEALRTTLAAAHENNPNLSLQKSTSNLTTASSQYSLIGSTDLGSVEGVSTESSAVLIRGAGVNDVKRGWDWRKGFPRGAKGEDVIRILRLGLAKELGRAFAEGEVAP